VLGSDGHIVDVVALLAHRDVWKQAIAQFVSATRPAGDETRERLHSAARAGSSGSGSGKPSSYCVLLRTV
jgi:hypothetical protein